MQELKVTGSLKTAEGNLIEFVAEVEIENSHGEKIGLAKAGLVITDQERFRGIGLENASFEKITKKENTDKEAFIGIDAIQYAYKKKNGEIVYLSRKTIENLLKHPDYQTLKQKYYGAS